MCNNIPHQDRFITLSLDHVMRVRQRVARVHLTQLILLFSLQYSAPPLTVSYNT